MVSALRSIPRQMGPVFSQVRFCHTVFPKRVRVESRDLLQLFHNKIPLLNYPDFYLPFKCKWAVGKISTHGMKEYVNAADIYKLGTSFYETTGSEREKDVYFENAVSDIEKIRYFFAPFASPMDLLRLQLDECWPHGATIASCKRGDRKKMFVGLIRGLDDGSGILPHEDKIERDDDGKLFEPKVITQFAANVYLQNPQVGGELVLYSESLDTPTYDRLRGDSYGIKKELLPRPAIVHKPVVGDLTFFNAHNLHAVESVHGDRRISISCFVGYQGDNEPLVLWS